MLIFVLVLLLSSIIPVYASNSTMPSSPTKSQATLTRSRRLSMKTVPIDNIDLLVLTKEVKDQKQIVAAIPTDTFQPVTHQDLPRHTCPVSCLRCNPR